MQNEFEEIIDAIGAGTPNAHQYQKLASLTVVPAGVEVMDRLDAFSASYAQAAMDLYLTIRGGEKVGYEPERDEVATALLPENLFTGLVPWNFGDPLLLSEFLLSWGQMLRALDLRPGEPSKVLEYGAGTGQLLLILARLGFDAYGVDINASSIAAVEGSGPTDEAAHPHGTGRVWRGV